MGEFCGVIGYDGWKPVVEWDGAGNPKAWNIYGPGPDEILWRYEPGNGTAMRHVRYHHDAHGNVTALLDGSGNLLETYKYDPFGKPQVFDPWDLGSPYPRTWSSYGNRFMFTGREYFPGLWLYDYRNRWYDAQLGRFLQTDPLGLQTEGDKLTATRKALFFGGSAPEAFSTSEMNLFRYCGDDPVDDSDPFGLDAEFTLMRDPYIAGQNPRASSGIMTITENGKFMGSMRVNAKGFYPDRQGIPAGNYVVLPKAQKGNFPKGTPAITSPSMRDKPGATSAGHPEGSVLIHVEGKQEGPDSRACVTCGPAGLKLATDVFNRNEDSTTMRIYNGPAVSKPNEIPRAIPVVKKHE